MLTHFRRIASLLSSVLSSKRGEAGAETKPLGSTVFVVIVIIILFVVLAYILFRWMKV